MSPDLAVALTDLCVTAQPATEYFREYGIDAAVIRKATGGVFLSPIRIVPPRFFEPDPSGRLAAWTEAHDTFGTTIDVVAWSTRKPDKVVTLLGRAVVLGAEMAGDPSLYFGEAPLHVFRTPLGWLQAECRGVAILEMQRAARWLIDVPTDKIAAEDDAHAREIALARRALIERQGIVVPANTKREPMREAA